jgi:hypothetical protein
MLAPEHVHKHACAVTQGTLTLTLTRLRMLVPEHVHKHAWPVTQGTPTLTLICLRTLAL